MTGLVAAVIVAAGRGERAGGREHRDAEQIEPGQDRAELPEERRVHRAGLSRGGRARKVGLARAMGAGT